MRRGLTSAVPAPHQAPEEDAEIAGHFLRELETCITGGTPQMRGARAESAMKHVGCLHPGHVIRLRRRLAPLAITPPPREGSAAACRSSCSLRAGCWTPALGLACPGRRAQPPRTAHCHAPAGRCRGARRRRLLLPTSSSQHAAHASRPALIRLAPDSRQLPARRCRRTWWRWLSSSQRLSARSARKRTGVPALAFCCATFKAG